MELNILSKGLLQGCLTLVAFVWLFHEKKVDELSLSYDRPVLFIQNPPKVAHFQWIRKKGSANICLSFKRVIEKRVTIKITGVVKKLGKIWAQEVECSPICFHWWSWNFAVWFTRNLWVIVRFYTVFAFRMFELVAAIQICIQNWKTLPMIFTRKRNKIKLTPNRTLTKDYLLI